MARMLGGYETAPCTCKGSREGWYKRRWVTGSDCFGPDTSTRWRKTVERREMRALVDAWMPHAADVLDPLDDPSDCWHGCAGGCDDYGSERCNFLCHPADLRDRAVAWAEQRGHCDPDGEPDWELVDEWMEYWRQMDEEIQRRWPPRQAPAGR